MIRLMRLFYAAILELSGADGGEARGMSIEEMSSSQF